MLKPENNLEKLYAKSFPTARAQELIKLSRANDRKAPGRARAVAASHDAPSSFARPGKKGGQIAASSARIGLVAAGESLGLRGATLARFVEARLAK